MNWKQSLLWTFLSIGLMVGAYFLLTQQYREEVPPAKQLMVEGKLLRLVEPFFIEDNHVFIYSQGLSDILPKDAFSIENNHLWIASNAYNVKFEDSILTKQIQTSDSKVNFPLKELNKGWYVELERFSEWAGITWQLSSDENLLMLDTAEEKIYGIIVSGGGRLYSEVEQKGKKLENIAEGEKVRILDEMAREYKIRTKEGAVGYVEKRRVNIYLIPKEQQSPFTTTRAPMSQYLPLSVTFEFVNSYPSNPDLRDQDRIEGLDVLCPTWFTLDEQGRVLNEASIRYVREAHQKGYRVWGMLKNGFDPKRTKAVLSDEKLMDQVVDSTAFYCAYYELDGINLDFENVYLQDQKPLNRFIEKLDAVLTRQGVVLSIDAAVPWGSEQWSLFLDRKSASLKADYIILMAYDEHYANSKVSGSVSSLPWAEKAIVETLKMVPEEKLILGVPLYTRIWRETPGEGGTVAVSSKAIGIKDQEKYLKDNSVTYQFDDNAGQMMAMWQEDKDKIKVWLEDEATVKARLKLAKAYKLSGVASWRRGLENPEFWTWSQEILKGK